MNGLKNESGSSYLKVDGHFFQSENVEMKYLKIEIAQNGKQRKTMKNYTFARMIRTCLYRDNLAYIILTVIFHSGCKSQV